MPEGYDDRSNESTELLDLRIDSNGQESHDLIRLAEEKDDFKREYTKKLF